ncbi:leucine Rich repeat-containing domain protein, partial [Teladorsagia circumcincta]
MVGTTFIRVGGTQIQSEEDFSCLSQKIERGLLAPFPLLEELHLGHNRISYIGYDSLRTAQIKSIRLNDNRIQTLGMHAFRFIPQLHEIDLSGNRMERFMMSDFSTATSLRILNASRNQIRSVECDSIAPMLNWLDLSSTAVRVVEAGAFSRLPRLHSVFFTNCQDLTFISPAAFENISVFSMFKVKNTKSFSLDISGTALKTLSPSLLSNIARVRIADVPLDCGCLSEQLSAITTTTITDWSNATCVTREGEVLSISTLSPTTLGSTEQCRPSVVLPFGHEVVANVGQTFKIYCAGTEEEDIVKWKSPAGVTEYAIRPEFSSGFERLDYFTTTLFEPLKRQRLRKRTLATTEFFRIDVVLNSDAGEYECTIQRGKYTFTRKIRLVVQSCLASEFIKRERLQTSRAALTPQYLLQLQLDQPFTRQ